MSLTALRQRIAEILDPPRTDAEGLPTGIRALDRVLTGGGVPRGRLTEVLGARGSGKTTVVRQVVERAVRAKQWVAYIDAGRTLAPRDWAATGESGRLWVVRPPRADRGVWCADILLRSGAFALVVLDGAPPITRPVAVRLTRLAQESDAAFIVMADEEQGVTVGGAVRLLVERRRGTPPVTHAGRSPAHSRLRLAISVQKGGGHDSVEVHCAIDLARRLRAYPEIPDRRGVASRNRRGERIEPTNGGARGGTVVAGDGARGATLARKRRCAEPAVRHDAFLLGER